MPTNSRYEHDDDDNDTSHFGADADDDQDENEEDLDEEEDQDSDQDDDDADRGDNVDGEGDEDEEGNEDEDSEADPAALRRIADGQDDDYVPRARLNEVLARESKLIDALVTKDGGTKKEDEPPPFDLKAKIKARNAKLLEGEEDAAADIDMEIEDYRMKEAEARADARAEAKINARLAQQETDRAIAEVMKQYPQLNDAKSNKAFDPEVLDEVITLRNGYIAGGMSVAEALRKSAKRLCKPSDAARDATRDPKRDAAGDGKAKNGRDPKAVQRTADAVRRTPPRPSSAGVGARGRGDANDLNPETMSEGRFADLSEDEMKKMRGDVL